ncbi:hypothetical protein [uncultured Gemmiger sp.]|nr:hypothetical protein [uncultured Gemmiger sp.]
MKKLAHFLQNSARKFGVFAGVGFSAWERQNLAILGLSVAADTISCVIFP